MHHRSSVRLKPKCVRSVRSRSVTASEDRGREPPCRAVILIERAGTGESA
jgi:hypothetical protein